MDPNIVVVERSELLKSNLQHQLDEFQMLSAIFCSKGELQVDDYGCIENITSYTNGESAHLHTTLDYRLNLPSLADEKFQILVTLPHLYPTLEIPRIVIRSAAIQRDQERMLTARIERFIMEEVIERDAPYIYQVICWIQDNVVELLQSTREKKDIQPTNANEEKRSITAAVGPMLFERLWIYSHHLKSKAKRQTIVKTARDLGLSGFSRPGKPAIICVEGHQCDTQLFWRTIKSLKWQKIQVKLSETSTMETPDAINDLRRFNAGFREEIFCEVHDASDAEDLPMSMSLFIKFLEKHDCAFIKKDIFGFHSSTDPPAS